MATHLLGSPTGDLGVYVWNLWIFAHETAVHRRWPLGTDHVFAFTFGTDFSLHNYTALAGVAAMPLITPLGAVTTFNVMLLLALFTSGLGVCAMTRQVGLSRRYAVVAGALFLMSPVMMARATAHFSLLIAVWLPLFVVVLQRLLTAPVPRWWDAVLLGSCVAAAFYSDAYYGVYCLVIGLVMMTWRLVRVQGRPAATGSGAMWMDLAMVVIAAIVVGRLITGASVVSLGPFRLTVATLYNPMLALVILAGLRVWVTYRPVVRLDDPTHQLPRLLRAGVGAITVTALLLLPVLADLLDRWLNDQLPETRIFWRSSPRGVDLLAYVIPDPTHPWFGHLTRQWAMPAVPDAFPEFIAAFPLAGWALVALARPWSGARRVVAAIAVTFFALSLGPFIHIAGYNTAIIGPWALLRYVPVIGMARSPARFAIVAVMALSVLAACGLSAAMSDGRRRWLAGGLLGLLAFELLPGRRPLYSASVPAVYRMLGAAEDERGRLLELPTCIRDGTSSLGDFNASSQFFQTVHRRPLVGGYLSRVSEARKRASRRSPVLGALLQLSAGAAALPPGSIEAARAGRERFLARTCVRYVLVDRHRASAALRAFAIDVLRLTPLHEDDDYELMAPSDAPPCSPTPAGRRARQLALRLDGVDAAEPDGGVRPPTLSPEQAFDRGR